MDLKSFSVWALWLAVACVQPFPGILAAQSTTNSQGDQLVVGQNGFFYGEEQYYIVEPPFIHVYYLKNGKPRGNSGTAEEYVHELFGLTNGRWAIHRHGLSGKPDVFLSADHCDTNNQLDLQGSSMRQVIPGKIRIKDIKELGDYSIVVYAEIPGQTWYSLKAALLHHEATGWRLVQTVFAGDSFPFCGTTYFPVVSESQPESSILLVYTSAMDPAGHDFVSIQSLLIKRPKTLRPKR